MKRYYFDYAAATPLDREAAMAMHQAESMFANPSSLHTEGQAARDRLTVARKQVAKALGAREREIVFTSSATEANNLALLGAITAAGRSGARILTVSTEHAAVRACTNVARASGYDVIDLEINQHGLLDIAALKQMLNDNTILISISMATSEIGTLQPIGEIGKLVRAVRGDRARRGQTTPIIFHTDASACAGLLPLSVDRLGVDLMTLSSAKIYGPHGAAALYVASGTPLTPLIIGGGQESSLRAGTPNLPAIVGFATALTKAEAMRRDEHKRLVALRQALWDQLKDLPGILLNGHPAKRLANVLNISFVDRDGEELMLKLDAQGFAVATGAACAESSRAPSHVLLGIGRSAEEAQGSLRISLGRDTTTADIRALALALRAIINA